jgi:hypothetical protein
MATLYQHRICLVIPVAQAAQVADWMRANVDPTCPPDIGPGLPAESPTHRIQSGAWTDAQAKAILTYLCDRTGASKLADWDTKPNSDKRTWLAGVRDAIKAGGLYVQLSDGPGVWEDPAEAIAAMKLSPIKAM